MFSVENSSKFELKSYNVTDLTLCFNQIYDKLQPTLTFQIRNIFNESYQIIRSYPLPGREFRISLGWFIISIFPGELGKKNGSNNLSEDYRVKDITLAPEGQKKIDWVSRPMKVLSGLSEKFLKDGAFRDKKISVCMHLASLHYILSSDNLENKVYQVPDEIDEMIVREKLRVEGTEIEGEV